MRRKTATCAASPPFALDDQGTKLLAVPYVSRDAVNGGKTENKSGAVRKSLSGGEAVD